MNKYLYFFSIVIFGMIPAFFEILFGYHFQKQNWKLFLKVMLLFVLIGPTYEYIALRLGVWHYPAQNNIGWLLFGVPFETIIFSLVVSLEIALGVMIWTEYEDKKKPILKSSIEDVIKGTYTIWRNKNHEK